MAKIDPFTAKRLSSFVDTFRSKSGELPTLKDFDASGFSREQVETAVKQELLIQLYVTLSNGTIVKGFKNSA